MGPDTAGASLVMAPALANGGRGRAAGVGARSPTWRGWVPGGQTAGAPQLRDWAQPPSAALLKPSAPPTLRSDAGTPRPRARMQSVHTQCW